MSNFSEFLSQIETYLYDDDDEADNEELKKVSEFKSKILKISQQCSVLGKDRQELREELEEECFINQELLIDEEILMEKKKIFDEFTKTIEANINLQRTLIDVLRFINIEDMDKYHKLEREYHKEFRLQVYEESCRKSKETLETLNEQYNSLECVKSLKAKIQKGKEIDKKLAELKESLKTQEQDELNCLRKEKDEMNSEVIKLATGYFTAQQFRKELPIIDANIASAEETILEQEMNFNLIEEENRQLQEMCKQEEDKKNDLLDFTPLSHIVFKIPKNPAVKKRKLSISEHGNERGVKQFLTDLKLKSKTIQPESECSETVPLEMSQVEKQEIDAEMTSSDTEDQHKIPKEDLEYVALSAKTTDNSSKKEDDTSKQQNELVSEQSKKNLPRIEIIENILIKPPEPQCATVDLCDISADSEVLNIQERSISLDHSYSQGSYLSNDNDQIIVLPSTGEPENLQDRDEEQRKTYPESFEKSENLKDSPDKIIEILDESGNDEFKDKSEEENILIPEKIVHTVEVHTVTKKVEKQPGKHHIDKSQKLSGTSRAKDSKKKEDFSFEDDIFNDDFFSEPKPSKRKKSSDSCEDTDGRGEEKEQDLFDTMEPTTPKKSKVSKKSKGDFEDFLSAMYNPGSDEDSNSILMDFDAMEKKSVGIPGESDFQLTSPSGSEGFVDNNENSN